MVFLVDVHLPISLSKFLNRQDNCSALHINQILQRWNTSDKDICNYADENDLIVITKDSDFKNSHFINKTPRRMIRVILGNISNNDLILVFEKYISFILHLKGKDFFYIEISEDQLDIIN